MYAVEVYSGLEQIAGPCQGHGDEIAAIRSAPCADARRIDIGAGTQVDARALHIITVRDEGDRLIAIAPLMAVEGPFGMFRRFEFLGTGHAGSGVSPGGGFAVGVDVPESGASAGLQRQIIGR